MLNKSERRRFNELRDRQDGGATLSPDEAEEVAVFFQRIEVAESVYLKSANGRLCAENIATEERI